MRRKDVKSSKEGHPVDPYVFQVSKSFHHKVSSFGEVMSKIVVTHLKWLVFASVILFGIISLIILMQMNHSSLDLLLWSERCILDEYSGNFGNLRFASSNVTRSNVNPDIDDESRQKQRFLLYGPQFGLSNQLIALRNAVLIGHRLNRTIIVPPLMDSSNQVAGGILYSTIYDMHAFQSRYPHLLIDFSDYLSLPSAQHSLSRMANIYFPFHILTPSDSFISSLSSHSSSFSLIINSKQLIVKPGLGMTSSIIATPSATALSTANSRNTSFNSSSSLSSITVPTLAKSASSWSRLLAFCNDQTLALSLTYGLHSSETLCPDCTDFEVEMVQQLFKPNMMMMNVIHDVSRSLVSSSSSVSQTHYPFACIHIRLTDFVESCKINANSLKSSKGFACDISLNSRALAKQIKHALIENNVWPSVVDEKYLNIFVSTDNVSFLSDLKSAMNFEIDSMSLKKHSESWVHSLDLVKFVTANDAMREMATSDRSSSSSSSFVHDLITQFGYLADSKLLSRHHLDKNKETAEMIVRALVDQFVCSRAQVKILNAFSTFSRMIEMYSEIDEGRQSSVYYWSSLDASQPKRVH